VLLRVHEFADLRIIPGEIGGDIGITGFHVHSIRAAAAAGHRLAGKFCKA
jgi:hypothetical protein